MKKLPFLPGRRSKNVCGSIIKLIAAFFIIFAGWTDGSSAKADPIVHVAEGDEWRYFKGTTKPPRQWTRIDFDDSSWTNGNTGFGYGNNHRTSLGDMQNNYSTVYSRRYFVIDNIYNVTGMTLSIVCDGAFIAYLNSVEIIRNNSASASASTEMPQGDQMDISGFIHELLPGKNVLSIECHNDDISSPDFSFVPFFDILDDQGRHKE